MHDCYHSTNEALFTSHLLFLSVSSPTCDCSSSFLKDTWFIILIVWTALLALITIIIILIVCGYLRRRREEEKMDRILRSDRTSSVASFSPRANKDVAWMHTWSDIMAVDYTGAEDRVRSRRTSFPAEGVDSLHANCDAMHGPLTRSSPDLRTSQKRRGFYGWANRDRLGSTPVYER